MTAVPTGEEMVARAKALRSAIRERAAAAEEARTISAESAAAFVAAGFPRILIPTEFDGYELGLHTWVDVVIEIAKADGAHGWLASQSAHHPHYLAQFPRAAREAVWKDCGPDALIAASLTPISTLERVDGGWRVSSETPYMSGINYATWAIVAGLVPTPAGPPDWTMLLVPRGEFTVADTWHVIGMRGTGSNTIVVQDVLIPDEHTVRVQDVIDGTSPGGLEHGAPVGSPWATWGPVTFVAPLIGIARGALEDCEERMRTQLDVFGEEVVNRSSAQVALGRIAADIDAAELLVRRACDVGMDVALQTPENRTRCLRDATRAAQLLVGAVEGIMEISGSGGFSESVRLQRAWRDVHFGATHVTLNADVNFGGWGRLALGLERSPAQAFY